MLSFILKSTALFLVAGLVIPFAPVVGVPRAQWCSDLSTYAIDRSGDWVKDNVQDGLAAAAVGGAVSLVIGVPLLVVGGVLAGLLLTGWVLSNWHTLEVVNDNPTPTDHQSGTLPPPSTVPGAFGLLTIGTVGFICGGL